MKRELLLTLRCRHCHARQLLTLNDTVDRLRELGSLRRSSEPSPELTRELALVAIEQGVWGACPECGTSALGSTDEVDEAEDPRGWGDAVRCERCRAVIPPERLEIFPHIKLCRDCQTRAESGEVATEDREFCARCGDVLQLKAVRTPVSGFRQYCPSCKKMW